MSLKIVYGNGDANRLPQMASVPAAVTKPSVCSWATGSSPGANGLLAIRPKGTQGVNGGDRLADDLS